MLKNCPDCGKPLQLITTLTLEEQESFRYIEDLRRAANSAMNFDRINKLELEKQEVYFYFKAAFEQQAKASFLWWCFVKELKEKYNIEEDNLIVFNGELYKHV